MNSYKTYIDQLTIDEKIELTSGKGRWAFFGIPRFNVDPLFCGDGPHGLRAYKKDSKNALFQQHALAPTTLFPIATAMASTFHPDLVYDVGKTIAQECNHHNIDLLLAPGVNLKRSPLGGRNFEYYSEDPYISGVMAAAYINGVQSEGIGACIKHFALNEQETHRRFINTIVDERTLHEVYLRPFSYAIEHASPFAIMSSYNRVCGDYAGESSFLLQDILRDKWNYKGLVISDWGGVQNKAKSIRNGMNIEMPGPGEFQDELREAIDNKDVSESELNRSLKPLFDFYDNVSNNPYKGQDIDFIQHQKVAYNVAKEAIVLLENDGILPLQKQTKITIVGERAKDPRINGGGSASLRPFSVENPFDFFQEAYEVTYAQGYDNLSTNDALLHDVEQAIAPSDVILFFTDATASLETEGEDRQTISIPQAHMDVFERIIAQGKPVIVVLSTGSSVDVSPFVGRANAIIQTWLLGSAHGQAIVEVVSGDVNPSGRLTETFPMELEQTPFYGQFPSHTNEVHYDSDLLHLGYRYYDLHHINPRYPFGYGLSYSTFAYTLQSVTHKDEDYNITLRIENTSDVDGMDVVQVYIGKQQSTVIRPIKTLQAFKKVHVANGAYVDIDITLPKRAFEVYNEVLQEFVVEPGDYQIYIGANSRDISIVETIHIDGPEVRFIELTKDHPLKAFIPYKTAAIEELQAIVGTIPWHNLEEPMQRLIRRFQKRHQWSDEETTAWMNRLLEI